MAENIETIALKQSEIMDGLVELNRKLITELAQYRAMDEEEKKLQEFVEQMGGGKSGT